MVGSTITPELVAYLPREFALEWRGIHGAPHWTRVRWNGLAIARSSGAITGVVELFSFLHDARRAHDGRDPDHGVRAAELALELNGPVFCVDRAEMRLLEIACRDHSEGQLRADPAVQTCWDADRLDLGRVGIRPDPARLCTDAARHPKLIDQAYRRSLEW